MISTIENVDISIKNGKFFREKIKNTSSGDHFVIQLRDIVHSERGFYLDFSNVVKRNLPEQDEREYLKTGDVLVTIKGVTKHAFLVNKVPTKTVPSQHFIRLRSPDFQKIIPEYIEYLVNLPYSQRWFSRKSKGGYKGTINSKILGALPFPVISTEEQKKIVALSQEVQKEKNLLLDLIENRELQLQAYTSKILKLGK